MLRLLELLLIGKISITAALWAGPFLLCPADWLAELLGARPDPIVFVRLLGVAYCALIVAYADGLAQVRLGVVPRSVVAMGLVSNGGALAVYAPHLVGAWPGLAVLPRVLGVVSVAALGSITAALAFVMRWLHQEGGGCRKGE